MLWVVHHEWASGAQFTFNCYNHWYTIVIWDKWWGGHFLYSKMGITQRDILSIILYSLGVIPLIR